MDKERDQIENGNRRGQSLSVNAARNHLNASPEKYFEIINGSDPEDLVEYIGKMQPLVAYLPNPGRVISVGVGGGLELHALRKLYPNTQTEVVGLDLSDKAIQVTSAYLKAHHVIGELIQGNAIDMPFAKEEKLADGIVLSSILHEVYSYVPDGKAAWKEAIANAARNLSNNGILLLRDFANPVIDGNVRISFLSNYAREFYQYFRQRYRTFQNWEEKDRNIMCNEHITEDDFPEILSTDESVTLPFDKASEMMLHFRNYADHINKNLIKIADPAWKEADETYLVPDPDSHTFQSMPPDVYCARVLQAANDALRDSDTEIICMSSQVSPRPNTAKFLMLHFELEETDVDSYVLFQQIPSKMELVFKKIKKPTGKAYNDLEMSSRMQLGSSTINELTARYPAVPVVDVEELMTEEEFMKQKQKQEEYPIEGAANGIILTRNSRIVLTKRTGPHPGWALPAGRVEMNETFDKALEREVIEECGIVVENITPLIIERKTFISPKNNRLPFLLVTFVGKSVSDQNPYQTEEAKREGLNIETFTLDDLPEDMLKQDRQKIIEYFSSLRSS